MVSMSPSQQVQALTEQGARHSAALITDHRGIGQVTPLCSILTQQGIGVDLVPAEELLAGKNLTRDYDLAVLDFTHFDGTGQQACATLRNTCNRLPIMILSADNSVADRIKGYESGADDYVGKPFVQDEVTVRVRALLRRGGNTKPQNILNYGDLTLDLASRVAHRGDYHVDLSRREFSLLSYFVQNAEVVLTRAEILENVWGQSSSHQSNVVDVYVNYLRNKIDQGPSGRLIHTVRGKGYILHNQWMH